MQSQISPSILLVTGSVGVGKSTVADEVYETLKARNEPVALINIDEFGYAAPRPTDDPFNTQLQLKNLAATWPNYSEIGVKGLIIPCVVETKDDIERFRSTIPAATVFVIQLNASLKTIESRIKGRHMGGSLAWHLQRAKELQEVFAKNGVADGVIETDNKDIAQVANEVITQWQG